MTSRREILKVLRSLSALLGLIVSRFHHVDLDVPKKLQHPLCDDTYCFALNVYPWRDVDVSTWDTEYSTTKSINHKYSKAMV